MDRLNEFLSMGGYGGYIWPAYLIAAIILIGLLVTSLRSVRGQEARLASLRQARRGRGEEEA
jgi:heme exporter protein D